MNFNESDIIIIKLVTGEEVIGRVKRKFHDGGVTLEDTRLVLVSSVGCYMENFLPFCDNKDFFFAPHSILTFGKPLEALVKFYHDGPESKEAFSVGDISLSTDTKH